MTGRKIHYSLLSLILSTAYVSTVQANYPMQRGGFSASIEAFDAKGNDSFLNSTPYAFSEPSIVASDTLANFNFFSNEPDFHWGFRVAVGYDFPKCDPCNLYGLSLEYVHFRNDFNNATPLFLTSTGVESPSLFAVFASGPTISELGPEVNFASAHTSEDIKYDVADVLGHITSPLGAAQIKLYGGARFIRFKNDMDTFYSFNSPLIVGEFSNINALDHVATESKFTGIGPRVGIGGSYPVYNCFGIVADTSVSLIFGRSRSNYSDTLLASGTSLGLATLNSITTTNNVEEQHFVSSLSGKIGLYYDITFRCCSSLSIEAGYRGDKYYEIVNNTSLLTSAAKGSVISSNSFTDFDISGPYVSLTYHI